MGNRSEFVIVDETSKNDQTYAQHFGQAVQGQCMQIQDVFGHGTWYSLCAALTMDGYLATQVIEGSYDADEFYSYIAEDVVGIFYFSCIL